MKGSKKEFARYLQSEYNDDYLEPLEDEDFEDTLQNASKYKQDNLTKQSNSAKHQDSKIGTHNIHVQNKYSEFDRKIRLSMTLIQEFALKLGEDANNCVKYFKDLHCIEDSITLKAYSSYYETFETAPMLFLSIVPQGPVYVWQINRLCPGKRSNYLVPDCPISGSKVLFPNISILMLAKIEAWEGEEIIEAKVLKDSEIYVMSRLKDDNRKLIIRLYHPVHFISTARINPFKENVIATSQYSTKLVIRGLINADETSDKIEITLWKNTTLGGANGEAMTKETMEKEEIDGKDVLVQRKICGNLISAFKSYSISTAIILKVSEDVTIYFDKESSIAIGWDSFCVDVLSCGLEPLTLDTLFYSGVYVYDKSLRRYSITYRRIPKFLLQIKKIQRPEYDKTTNEWRAHHNKNEAIKSYLSSTYPQKGTTYLIMVYNISLPLINPYLKEEKITVRPDVEDQNEMREDSLNKKLDKIKKEFKQATKEPASEEKQREIMKELRSEISSKLKEAKQYEERKENAKNDEQPEEVSRKVLELYKEMKAEKKRIAREEGRKKDQRKKNEFNNDEA